MDKNLILDILKVSVTPALGCTEPGAVAYGVARAYELLQEEVEILNIYVDKNILKNGMFVSIPGTKEKGIMFAAALALVCGKSDYKLQVLKDVTDKDIEKAKEILNKKIIKLSLEKDIEGLYIKVFAKSKNHEVEVIIKNNHDNIVYEKKDEQVIKSNDDMKTIDEGSLKNRIKEFNIDELIDFADTIEFDKIKFIDDGIKMNKKIAYAGYNEEVGIGISKMLKSQVKDAESLAKALTAAASEARMSGYPLPVMSSAGSGNHGLVAILPISVIGQENGFSTEKIIRAVTLSHLLTGYVKAYIGILSPICGCGVAAGVGASAGLTYMYGGSKEQIKAAVKNVLAGISGMICDGAKIGCAYKLSISVTSALEASKLALNDMFIPSDNGILGITAEETIQNLGIISNEGMKNTDDVILDIMLKKQ